MIFVKEKSLPLPVCIQLPVVEKCPEI